MGYTIRDYITDEISKDIFEVEQEYNVEIKIVSGDNEILKIYKDDEYVSEIEINLDSKLANTKEYLSDEIENNLKECVGCGEWFDEYFNDEVDLDLTDDEYYHSAYCLEKHDNQLWDRYCKALGD